MAGEERPLCRLDEIEDPGSKGFSLHSESGSRGFFVVRRGGSAFAYANRCPHTGAPLEWLPDRFLDPDGAFIQCSLHGALFRLEDGRCLRGPCVGEALDPLGVRVRGGHVFLIRP
ncbi:MAG: Rieske (2Fe-2S) protein [Chromatiales bacterium]